MNDKRMLGKLVALVVLSLTMVGCGQQAGGGRPAGPQAVKVVVARAERRLVPIQISAVGTLEAKERIDVAAEVDGPIEGIAFEEGDLVVAGQLLFCIDKAVLVAEVEQARPALALAERNLVRTKELYRSKTASRQELDEAQQSFDTARANLAIRQRQLERACVAAPFAGHLGARRVSQGQFVRRGEVLVSLVADETLKVDLSVSEGQLASLKEELPVVVTVAAYPTETFRGVVTFISPEIDPNTRTVTVRAELANPNGRLKPGMFCQAEIIVDADHQGVVVPDEAILVVGDAASVMVVDSQQKVARRPVTVGRHIDGFVEIETGLAAGETVVREGQQKLRPGATVVPAEGARIPATAPISTADQKGGQQ